MRLIIWNGYLQNNLLIDKFTLKVHYRCTCLALRSCTLLLHRCDIFIFSNFKALIVEQIQFMLERVYSHASFPWIIVVHIFDLSLPFFAFLFQNSWLFISFACLASTSWLYQKDFLIHRGWLRVNKVTTTVWMYVSSCSRFLVYEFESRCKQRLRQLAPCRKQSVGSLQVLQ